MPDNQTTKNRKKTDFDKYLSPIDVWAIAFGCIVGWGAFVMPGTTFLPVAGPAGTLISIGIGTVIMLIIGSNYSYLMELYPGTGGVYSYTKQAFGRDHAFLCSWFLSLSYLTIVFLNATALFVISRTLIGNTLQIGFHYSIAGYDIYISEIALSAFALTVVGLLFILKKPLLQGLQTLLSIILFLGVIITAVFILPHLHDIDFGGSFFSGDTASFLRGIMTIVLLAPWAFVGFDAASLETAHFRFSEKKSRGIVTLSILLSGLVYILLALVGSSLVPDGYSSLQEYINDLDNITGVAAVPTFYAAKTLIGNWGLWVMIITALAAILTGIICAYRATTRVLSTMAEDKILSDKFLGTTFCILFIMLISIMISFLGRNALEWFVDLTSFGAIVGFGCTSASAYKTASAHKNKRVCITGAAGTVISAVFGFVQLISKVASVQTMGAESFLLLALWCLVGFVFYWRTMRQGELSDYGGVTTTSTVLFCLLFYSVLMWFAKGLLNSHRSEQLNSIILRNSILLFLIVFVGLVVMLYIQGMLRKRHEKLQIEKIRADEGSKAKSQFLFNMSHDIRTPMNAILGYTHLAEQEENVPPKIQEYIEKIDISGKHLLTLINDVLEMSQIESGKLELHTENADICQTASTAFDMFRAQMADKNIHYELDIKNIRNTHAVFDKTRFLRAMLNLLSNACKFTHDGGSVSVSLSQLDDERSDIGTYELRVKDNGTGMTKEFAETVFEAFARERTSTVSKIQGTGLGMAITKNIIDAMDGSIEVRTEPDKGTEFVIRISLPIADVPVADEQENDAKKIDFSKIRLLLVEDNEINSRLAKMILNRFGCTVDTAENGKIALDIISGSQPGYYDAVLMDIQMPVMDGYTAAKAIRALNDTALSAIPIIAMTANAFTEDERAAAAAGMQAHISKPLDVDKMMNTISAVLMNSYREKQPRI